LFSYFIFSLAGATAVRIAGAFFVHLAVVFHFVFSGGRPAKRAAQLSADARDARRLPFGGRACVCVCACVWAPRRRPEAQDQMREE
jgi:hypothetical protein